MNRQIFFALIGVVMCVGAAQAQETAPPVVPVSGAQTHAADVVLRHTIAVHLDHVTVADAITQIAAAAGLDVSYSRDNPGLQQIVSLSTDQVTVGDAFRAILGGTDLEPVVLSAHRIALSPRGRAPEHVVDGAQQGTATISGSVRDSATQVSIPQVTVRIDGTTLQVKSGNDGQYKIAGIAAGEYRVTARRVGYLAKTRTITLADGDNKKLDFGLNPPATQLNEVVTTALGEQRRYEVGNDISVINVDSIAPNAPVTSVTDILAARVPGLQVVQTSGLVGAGPAIRIWGQSSLLLQSDPIIIVDGIRVDNTPGGSALAAGGYVGDVAIPSPSRINDMDLSDIESISVLKGPAATTEYGTDAANGVIVITTKRGHAGRPTWDASAMESAMVIPTTFPKYYWDWGHGTDGSATPTWTLANFGVPCLVTGATAGTCVVDSITAFNPLNATATTEYGIGPSSNYVLSVGGGDELFQYHIAGDVQNEEGVVHIPDVFRSEATALGYSNSALDPNSQNQSRVSANGNIQLRPTVAVTLSGAYMSTYQETPAQGFQAPANGPVLDDSAFLFGYGAPYYGNSQAFQNPLYDLGDISSQQTERWTGAGTVNWRPASWLTANLTTGIDHEAQIAQARLLPQASVVRSNFQDSSGGAIAVNQERNDTYTFDFRTSATTAAFHHLHLVTTFGVQYAQNTQAGLEAHAGDLPASAFSLDGPSVNVGIFQSASSSVTAGVYGEEELQIGDRCFVPLALRFDAGSAFGAAAGTTTYPKWGLSCLVLTGPVTLRLRGAYGGAGVQPPQGSAALEFAEANAQFGNNPFTTSYIFQNPGNPNVKPEYDRDWEGGADFTWGSRLSVSFTAYDKDAHNLLYTIPLGISLFGSYTENVGDVRNNGGELEIMVVPVAQRSLTATVTFSGAINHNKLLRLAPNILSDEIGSAQYFVPGYSIYGYFGDSIRYADKNDDGVLERNEFSAEQSQPNPPPLYMGSSLPVTTITVAPSVALLPHQLILVNALFQYAGGYKVYDTDDQSDLYSQAVNTLGVPLWLQAYNLPNAVCQGCGSPYANSFLDGDYVAWNELSVALALPVSLARACQLRNAHVVMGVQNLALWTMYPFGDPRVSDGATWSLNSATNNPSVNNDIRSTGAGAVPLTRQWMLRVNIGF